jgi:hypothetical protein
MDERSQQKQVKKLKRTFSVAVSDGGGHEGHVVALRQRQVRLLAREGGGVLLAWRENAGHHAFVDLQRVGLDLKEREKKGEKRRKRSRMKN